VSVVETVCLISILIVFFIIVAYRFDSLERRIERLEKK